MPDDDNEQTVRRKTDSVEDQEEYLIHRDSDIYFRLRQLVKNKCLITADFAGKTFITAIIDVQKDKGKLILDYSAHKKLNRQLLSRKQATFFTQLDGVRVKFKADQITQAKYQGEPVFVMPIPKQLSWAQRRDAYRVRLPVSMTANCKLLLGAGISQLDVIDISVTGVALKCMQAPPGIIPGTIIKNCFIRLAEVDDFCVDLEVHNIFYINEADPEQGMRIGCDFINASTDTTAMLQRFISNVERERRQFERE